VNRLNLWKNIEELSVDEFMCLLFELEPGTVQFDYGNPKSWPENADLIYRMLTKDLQAKKLRVFFDDINGDPFYNGAYDLFYAGNDNPWWAACDGINSVGKIHRRELVKWLAEKGITSDFFSVPQAPSKDAEHEGSTEPKEQASTHDTASATTTAPQPSPTESILSLPSVRQRVSTEGQDTAQVRNTHRDNPEAVAYVAARQKQGAKPEEIAAELEKAGGGVAVIGCLLDITKANVKSAREHGKYLLKKAKQL
jgi:pyruvate/2-oxoglutarate dehydrogenase complex dihydrolipoamide acyltransferase (E2) component